MILITEPPWRLGEKKMVLLLSERRLLLEFNENILPVKTLALIWWILLQSMLYSASAIFIAVLSDSFMVYPFFYSPSIKKDPKILRVFHRHALEDKRTCIYSFFFLRFGLLRRKGPILDFLLWNYISWVFPLQWQWQFMHAFGDIHSLQAFTNLAAYWVALFLEKVIFFQKNDITFILHEIFIKWLGNCRWSSLCSGNKCQIIWLASAKAQDSVCKSVILILTVYQKHLCDILKMLCVGRGRGIRFFFF